MEKKFGNVLGILGDSETDRGLCETGRVEEGMWLIKRPCSSPDGGDLGGWEVRNQREEARSSWLGALQDLGITRHLDTGLNTLKDLRQCAKMKRFEAGGTAGVSCLSKRVMTDTPG